jgi:protocatechuate 4,5-dioxygenase beta chain
VPLVALIGCPHDPTLGAAAAQVENPEPVSRALGRFVRLRARLHEARPDVIVVVAGDHLNQWFMDNMPAFLVGKAARLQGPFPDEQHAWRLAPYDVPVHGAFARTLLSEGIERGIDLSYSDEFTADHAFTVPLGFLRPEMDVPVVPLFTNVMAPPVPTGRRFYEVGRAVRAIAEASALRVAVVATGHMSNSVGGPGMLDLRETPRSEWDTRMWGHVEAHDVERIVSESTWDQLYAAGNGTPGFLDFVLAYGVADGTRPDVAELIASTAMPACAFFAWTCP